MTFANCRAQAGTQRDWFQMLVKQRPGKWRDKPVEVPNKRKKIWITDDNYFTEQHTNAGLWSNLNQMQIETEVI